MKQQICTILQSYITSNGSGDRESFTIRHKVVAGPKPVQDRMVFLSLNREEAEELIASLQKLLGAN